MTPEDYWRVLGYESNGLVSLVLNGRRKVPLERLEDWLAPLDLSDDEYGGIYLAALSDYAPSYVLDIINTAQSIINEMGNAITAERLLLGRPTSPLPTLPAALARRRRPGRGGSPGSSRARP